MSQFVDNVLEAPNLGFPITDLGLTGFRLRHTFLQFSMIGFKLVVQFLALLLELKVLRLELPLQTGIDSLILLALLDSPNQQLKQLVFRELLRATLITGV